MILVDYSGVALGAFVSERVGKDEDLLRHVILNNLRSYNKKHKDKYGEMVLCMDHHSWRKDEFEWYKFRRREGREKDSTDWDKVFEILNKISDEIKQNLPWKCLHVRGAEGDDCIATMTQYCQEFGQWQPVMIIAADKDYVQLQKHGDVKQWSLVTKKLVKEDPHRWLTETIMKGQGKDGVPNIRTDGDFFTTEGGRQKPISEKLIQKVINTSPEEALTESELSRYKENQRLLDFDFIPSQLKEKIVQEYEQYKVPPTSGLLNYFIRARCGGLVDCISDFNPGKIE